MVLVKKLKVEIFLLEYKKITLFIIFFYIFLWFAINFVKKNLTNNLKIPIMKMLKNRKKELKMAWIVIMLQCIVMSLIYGCGNEDTPHLNNVFMHFCGEISWKHRLWRC